MQACLGLMIVVLGIALVFQKEGVQEKIENEGSSFEGWASQSRTRVFGLPLAIAAAISLAARVCGVMLPMMQIFANLFGLFILFAAGHALAGMTKIRLGMQMSFMTVFFVMLLNLGFMIERIKQIESGDRASGMVAHAPDFR